MKVLQKQSNLITILCAIAIILVVSAALFATNQGSFQCELEERITSWSDLKWGLDKFITILTIVGAALLAQSVLHGNTISREVRSRKLDNLHSSLIEISDSLRIFKTVTAANAGERFEELNDIFHKFTIAESNLALSGEEAISIKVNRLRASIGQACIEITNQDGHAKWNMDRMKTKTFKDYFNEFTDIEGDILNAYDRVQKGNA